jgi:hypothetical protein
VTISIGAAGPNAGRAVFEALRAAEAVGRGAIGGFAAFAAIDAEGHLHRHATQRGGSRTLFVEGESTGLGPPAAVAEAGAAAVISSGPDRPEPLADFLAAEPGAGLVTGHRLPNAPDADGVPLNVAALREMLAGRAPREAVESVLGANPEADAGLVAVDRAGRVHAGNSARVARRPDLGHARREAPSCGARIEVLHNAIRPHPELADLAAAIGLQAMVGEPAPLGWLTVNAGVPVTLGNESAVYCDDGLVARQVVTTDPTLLSGRQAGAAIYLHSRVYRGDAAVGLTLFEPIVVVEDGRLVSLSGQPAMRLSYGEATA